MKLNEAIPLMRSGDLLFFRSTPALFSRLIRVFTESVYNHVAVFLWIENHAMACESMEGYGVRLLALEDYFAECCRQGIVVEWHRAEIIDRDMPVKYCLDRCGRKYSSWLQFAVSFLPMPKAARHWFKLNPVLDPERAFCSWFAADCLLAAGFKLQADDPDEKDPWKVDPGALSRWPGVRKMATISPTERQAA